MEFYYVCKCNEILLMKHNLSNVMKFQCNVILETYLNPSDVLELYCGGIQAMLWNFDITESTVMEF